MLLKRRREQVAVSLCHIPSPPRVTTLTRGGRPV
jgi:hypothetical protein